MNAQEIAKRIVAEDMGARKRMEYISEMWEVHGNGLTLTDFMANVSDAECALLGIDTVV